MSKKIDSKRVGVFGPTSFVGALLLPLLVRDQWKIEKYSRKTGGDSSVEAGEIPFWICVAPLWVLPEYFDILMARGARRIIALSTTSRFTKGESQDPNETETAKKFVESEAALEAWAEANNVEWMILRPTLIYGFARDKNIAEISRFIGKFGFFPLFGKAEGLRQPIHAEDVAAACARALLTDSGFNHAYNISGGETLRYCEMVTRVFQTMNRPVRTLNVPLWAFKMVVSVLRRLPRFRHWSFEMATRMNRDLVFDNSAVTQLLGVAPRKFQLTSADVV